MLRGFVGALRGVRVLGRGRLICRELCTQRNLQEHTFVSFFLFRQLQSPSNVADRLRTALQEEKFRGTIYVAPEGVNGQFSIPVKHISKFQSLVRSGHPSFSSISFNFGDRYEEGERKEDIHTFKKLSIKERNFILTDGLKHGHNIDWSDYGSALCPKDWHEEVASVGKDSSSTILLDCRNDYESEIGSFENAIPLNTKVFSETFDAIKPLLEGKPKNTRVLTFCTGGIRCVKVNTFLAQELGYVNTATLEDGIVGYKNWLKTTSSVKPDLKSTFRGHNYVFDRRRVQDMSVGTEAVLRNH